jgi:hypothetical protein
MMMKFPIPNGIGCEQGDQELARSCYSVVVRGITRSTSGLGDASYREGNEILGIGGGNQTTDFGRRQEPVY